MLCYKSNSLTYALTTRLSVICLSLTIEPWRVYTLH
uniref:Uncharacterized protein n=1 Tax=Arundo donax TaxID=35708 RepID=A0A0A9BQM9_ARUDO